MFNVCSWKELLGVVVFALSLWWQIIALFGIVAMVQICLAGFRKTLLKTRNCTFGFEDGVEDWDEKAKIFHFRNVVESLCAFKHLDAAKQLIFKLISDGPIPYPEKVFSAIIIAYVEVGEVEQALEMVWIGEFNLSSRVGQVWTELGEQSLWFGFARGCESNARIGGKCFLLQHAKCNSFYFCDYEQKLKTN
ncbi:hypothetical protein MtrunA17_Chr6g0449441 [Medicago truncatula]|uniref:Pentatricopeptide repeat-containing protein n=1 Tax=Medicago truncatula TaxID=3880 RepID=A0A396HD30_MEDTR|nr:hypothetical protein MtrunA17_Chr6g0449441 [Medicago truncatula]